MSNQIHENICEKRTFEYLFHLHGQVMRNFLYYKCGSLSLAEDWLQEAFLKLWQECGKVSVDKARSFLFKVANNIFLDHTRHQKVVLKFEQKTSSDSSFTENPHFLLETSELQTELENAISGLPEHQRIVFLMNRFDDLKYAEIAELLNISVKAVEKRMHGALITLRQVLKSI